MFHARIEIPPQRLEQVPVLLLGGVNLVRSLGEAGIPAIVASSDPAEPALASRYCVGRCLLPPLDNSEAAADALAQIGNRLSIQYGGRVPLMYGSDDALQLIYAHRERLERYFLMRLNDVGVAHALLEKDRFQAFAEARGLPVPRSLSWETLAQEAGPVLMKPSSKSDWTDSLMKRRLFGPAKALVFKSGIEAAAHEGVKAFSERLTFQEYVPGDDEDTWSYHAYADGAGRVLASFIGRKLRTYPVGAGESAFIEIARDAELDALGREIVARVPLKGVLKMDLKRHAQTGRWYLLEVNARFNLWHYLGARNGVNLLQAAYDDLLDRPMAARSECDTRYRWLSLELDARAFLELRRRGELGLAGWLASIVGSRNVYNVFAWRDPGPWLRFWGIRLGRARERLVNAFLMRIRQWRSTES